MIVKNEEAVLERCLTSARPYVDEIVIVDTGSTDKTLEIAKQFDAKIGEFTWIDDFAAARNAALDIGASDWVLALDADEELAQGQDSLAELIKNPDALAIHTQIVVAENPASISEALASFETIRLFKRSADIRYIWPIHEHVHIDDHSKVYPSDIIINHFGPKVIKNKNSSARNISMLLEAVKDLPEEGMLWERLGVEYFGKQEWQSAFQAYSQAARVSSHRSNFIPRLLRDSTLCLFYMGRREEAFEKLRSLQKKLPDFTDLFFLEAQLHLELGENDKAAHMYRVCLEKGDSPPAYGSWAGTGSWRARKMLEEALHS